MPELTLPIAVFSSEINGQEKVIVVQEIEAPLHEQEYKRLVENILNAVSNTHQLEIYDIYLLLKEVYPKREVGKSKERSAAMLISNKSFKHFINIGVRSHHHIRIWKKPLQKTMTLP